MILKLVYLCNLVRVCVRGYWASCSCIFRAIRIGELIQRGPVHTVFFWGGGGGGGGGRMEFPKSTN